VPHRIGDVGADVFFLLAAEYLDDGAVCVDGLVGSGLFAPTGGFHA